MFAPSFIVELYDVNVWMEVDVLYNSSNNNNNNKNWIKMKLKKKKKKAEETEIKTWNQGFSFWSASSIYDLFLMFVSFVMDSVTGCHSNSKCPSTPVFYTLPLCWAQLVCVHVTLLPLCRAQSVCVHATLLPLCHAQLVCVHATLLPHCQGTVGLWSCLISSLSGTSGLCSCHITLYWAQLVCAPVTLPLYWAQLVCAAVTLPLYWAQLVCAAVTLPLYWAQLVCACVTLPFYWAQLVSDRVTWGKDQRGCGKPLGQLWHLTVFSAVKSYCPSLTQENCWLLTLTLNSAFCSQVLLSITDTRDLSIVSTDT